MVIKHEYPFSIVEHKGFINFIQTAQPWFFLPGRKTLRNDCVKLFQQLKRFEMENINKIKHLTIMTDLWTSSDLTGYMVVTAHYINDKWNLIKRIISFRPLLSPHTGQVISDRLSQILLEWKALNKVAFVTLDNASSNNVAVSRLQRFIHDRSQTPGIPATSNFFHIRCAAHVINLIVKDGLKQISGPIDRLRESSSSSMAHHPGWRHLNEQLLPLILIPRFNILQRMFQPDGMRLTWWFSHPFLWCWLFNSSKWMMTNSKCAHLHLTGRSW